MTTARRVKVITVDVDRPVGDIHGLSGYDGVLVIVRFHGTPVAAETLPVQGEGLSAGYLARILPALTAEAIRQHLLSDFLSASQHTAPGLLTAPHWNPPPPFPTVTVAICTRDRPDDLRVCLDAVQKLDPAPLEVLVVDNAPSNTRSEEVVRNHPAGARYTREPRPGLDWARNRALAEARGEIIAYTDDDVVVDRGWVGGLATTFSLDPDVMAVTGLVLPLELETASQVLFERYGGFGRGFRRRWFRAGPAARSIARRYAGAGQFGTGANMAYRRETIMRLGGFDPALDVGTPTHGGGDLEMFFRVLKAGYTLVYSPEAVVYHRHRREYHQLRRQLANNGIGFYAYLARVWWAYPEERLGLLRLGAWWLGWWSLRRLLISWIRPRLFPRDLILAEFAGSLIGPGRYLRARREAVVTAAVEDSQVEGNIHAG